jgi:predicted DCC family thiol-disulfide oxidoreductase YuxK
MIFPDKPLILFDGVCNLCNGSVQFVIKHDKESKFLFTSLQSEKGQEILKHLGMKTDNFDTFILLDKGKIYTKSSGVLKEADILGGWFKIFTIFYLVPAFVRDLFYSFVARNRYRFFGKQDACMIPTPELKARFLQ